MQKNNHFLVLGAGLIAALKIISISEEIEKMSVIIAGLLITVSVTVFFVIEMKNKENTSIFQQVLISLLQLLIFFGFIYLSGYLKPLVSEIQKHVDVIILLKIIGAAIGAAVLEEIVFRKILLQYFQQYNSNVKAVLITSFIFFFFHFTFNPTLILIGILYGYLAIHFKSLLAVVMMHFIYDFNAYLSQVKVLGEVKFEGALTASNLISGSNGVALFAMGFLVFLVYFFSRMIRKYNIRRCRDALVT